MLDRIAYWIGFGLIPFFLSLPIIGIISMPRWRQVPVAIGANLLVAAVAVATGSILAGIIGGVVAGFILKPFFHRD